MKEHIYFYNREFFTNYMEGYAIAEKYFIDARNYWAKTIDFAKTADSIKGWHLDGEFQGRHKPFENTLFRIKTGDLNYYKIIDNLLYRINKNRKIIESVKQ